MKYYIKTTDENGQRLPEEAVFGKRKAVKEKIIDMGLQYIEYEVIFGRLNAEMHRVEERMHVIEMMGKDFYV